MAVLRLAVDGAYVLYSPKLRPYRKGALRIFSTAAKLWDGLTRADAAAPDTGAPMRPQ